MELVIAIGFYNGMARTLRTLGIDVEPRLQPLLEKFPLPGSTAYSAPGSKPGV